MAVAKHLKINLDEYDERIRSFIPRYDAMIAHAAGLLKFVTAPSPLVVDLGVGTGALAAACLSQRPDARLYAVDEDAAILEVARQRLGQRPNTTFVHGSFAQIRLPACDTIVASFALHHVRSAGEKSALYAACRDALRPGGLLISADCFTASDPAQRAAQWDEWRAHLEHRYATAEAEAFLAAWAEEDVYFPLLNELEMLQQAQLVPDVVWRSGAFAVISARRADVEGLMIRE